MFIVGFKTLLWSLSAIWMFSCQSIECTTLCGKPPPVQNAQDWYQFTSIGANVFYVCNPGYSLLGPARRTCQANGTWDGVKPYCFKMCSFPTIPSSIYIVQPINYKRIFKTGEMIILRCKKALTKKSHGDPIRVCVNGKWTQSSFKCGEKRDKRCVKMLRGLLWNPPKNTIININIRLSKARFRCREGYMLEGNGKRSCCRGQWIEKKQPKCTAVDCGPLNAPVDGTIIERVAFTYGHRIVFECKSPGYEMKGSKIRTCQSDGQWSGSVTKCEIIKCGDPGTPANGIQKVKRGFVYGGSVTFVCIKDYILDGTDTTYCRADKSWNSPVPRCLAPCQDPGDPYQGNRIGQDFRHGQTVRFTCPRNHVMESVAAIKCSDGRWDNAKPSCKSPPGLG